MNNKTTKELFLIIFALIIFSAVKFFDVNVKQVEEVHPFEMVETGVVHNDSSRNTGENQNADFKGTEDDIISLTNEYRKEKGLDVLVKNDKLMESAKMKAQDMRDLEYFAHVSPDGVEPWNIIQKTGYNYSIIAENIAEGYFSATSVVEDWMNSEGHRNNILSTEFEDIGVAILETKNSDDEKSYVLVQHFATPQKELNIKRTTEVICDKKVKDNCKKIEEKKEEYQELVKDQRKIIEKAESEGFSRKDLNDLYSNLEALQEARDQYKEFANGCEEYTQKCNRWE
jgi:uncharacterized protein YkwD/uncharacterized protein (UPF0335 family)